MDEVLVREDGAVRTVVLNRPDKRNALNLPMLDALAAVFATEPPADERVTVLRAEGPAFCSGLDLAERQEAGPPAGESPIQRVLEAVEAYPLPVVAVVHGDAIAGGTELALHCDIVVASTRASFGMSVVQLGLAPPWALADKLTHVAGPALAAEMLLLGDPVPAGRLADIGVIARAVPHHELDRVVAAIADRLAANGPLSLRAVKAMLVRLASASDALPHDDVENLADAARASADAREGIAARLERRPPRFSGR